MDSSSQWNCNTIYKVVFNQARYFRSESTLFLCYIIVKKSWTGYRRLGLLYPSKYRENKIRKERLIPAFVFHSCTWQLLLLHNALKQFVGFFFVKSFIWNCKMKFRIVSAGLLAKQQKITKVETKSSEFKVHWQFSLKQANYSEPKLLPVWNPQFTSKF